MNYVGKFNILGTEARQRPMLVGFIPPSDTLEGTAGELYMEAGTNRIYKCLGEHYGDNGTTFMWSEIIENPIHNILNSGDADVEFEAGRIYLARVALTSNFNPGTVEYTTQLVKCTKSGLKSSLVLDPEDDGFEFIPLDDVRAHLDSKGRVISEYYASKDDIGDISTALDELHTYAQGIVNGGVSE